MKTHTLRVTVPKHLLPYTKNTVTIDVDADTDLPDMLEALETFLKAIGYCIGDGERLDIVKPNEEDTPKNLTEDLNPYKPPVWIPHKSTQRLVTHPPEKCVGEHCAVHNVSDHHMKDWPQNYRHDRGITERICPHGIGHIDPDDPTTDRVHGCDGCCTPPEK